MAEMVNSPVAVVAAATPSDCFHMAIEASRLALTFMSPVILLTDGYLANGSEPWNIPSVDSIPEIPVKFHTDPETYKPYSIVMKIWLDLGQFRVQLD